MTRVPPQSLFMGVMVLSAGVFLQSCRSQTAQEQSGASTNGGSQPTATTASQHARPRVVVLGDSLTAGYGLVATQTFPYLLQQRMDREGYDFEVVNAGVSGDTSAGGVRRLDWALDGDVKVLIVALGGNDGLRGLSIEEMKKNIGEIVRRARERRITVILAGMQAPPNYGPEYAAAFREAFRDIAREHRVPLIPFLLNNVAGNAELNLQDGIHPNSRGTAIVSDTVWSALRPVLDKMSANQ